MQDHILPAIAPQATAAPVAPSAMIILKGEPLRIRLRQAVTPPSSQMQMDRPQPVIRAAAEQRFTPCPIRRPYPMDRMQKLI